MEKEKGMIGPETILLAEGEGCKVFRLQNESGDGTMTCYEVFPGAILTFNDFHMEYYDSAFTPQQNLFAVDHCREGRMEYPAARDAYAYQEPGDLKFDKRLTHTGRFFFPSGHYHGLSILFDMNKASNALQQEIRDFPVIEHDLDLIRNADYIIDMGPGGGEAGGQIVAAGCMEEIIASPESETGKFL